jgi:hypothetical protein
MSQCNHLKREFDCNAADLVSEVKTCLIQMFRFSGKLKNERNVHLKCFNPIPIQPYLDYMGARLQPRRISTHYVHRETNTKRSIAKECIWENPTVAAKVAAILGKIDYYRFCNQCIGSTNDLLAV